MIIFPEVKIGMKYNNTNFFNFESKRKDTSLVIMRSFQYFFEYRHQLNNTNFTK